MTGRVIIKPKTRMETPDGPLYATEVGGAIVHGGAPMTPEDRDAISEILSAAHRHLAKMRK